MRALWHWFACAYSYSLENFLPSALHGRAFLPDRASFYSYWFFFCHCLSKCKEWGFMEKIYRSWARVGHSNNCCQLWYQRLENFEHCVMVQSCWKTSERKSFENLRKLRSSRESNGSLKNTFWQSLIDSHLFLQLQRDQKFQEMIVEK